MITVCAKQYDINTAVYIYNATLVILSLVGFSKQIMYYFYELQMQTADFSKYLKTLYRVLMAHTHTHTHTQRTTAGLWLMLGKITKLFILISCHSY